MLGDPGTAPPQPVVLPWPVVAPYGSSLESGCPRASRTSSADPRTVLTECKVAKRDFCALAFLLVAVAVSRPGAPVPLSLGASVFFLAFLPFPGDALRTITFGLRPRASHSCSLTGGTSGRKRWAPTPKPELSGNPHAVLS